MAKNENNRDTQRRILVDKKKCQGCMTCMLVCSLVHEGKENLSLSRIQVIQNSFEKFPSDIETPRVQACDLCADAPFWSEPGGEHGKQACVEACPLGAIRLSTDISLDSENGETEVNFRGKGWKKVGYPVD